MRPHVVLFLLAALSVGTLAASGSVAHAGKPCHEQVLDEWIDTETVSASYALSCYDKALQRAPDDLLLYSSFEDDVLAAKSKAVRAQASAASPSPAPQPAPAAAAPAPAQPPPPPPPAAPAEPLVDEAGVVPLEDLTAEELLDPIPEEVPTELQPLPVPAEPPPVLEAPAPVEPLVPLEAETTEPAQAAPVIEFLRDVGPSDSSSIPVPLIVLTIVAGLLALAGAGILGYRQYHARRYEEAPPLPPRPPDSSGSV